MSAKKTRRATSPGSGRGAAPHGDAPGASVRSSPHAKPSEPGPAHGPAQSATSAFAAFASTTVALSFYSWMIGGPLAMGNIELRVAGFDPFGGLPVGFGLGLVAAALLHGAMTASATLRSRRGAVALASVALYLAAGVPAIGRSALVLAPIAMGVELAWIVYAKSRSIPGSLLITLHLGAFVSAAGFFHDWARYAAAWEPFVRSAKALGTLLF